MKMNLNNSNTLLKRLFSIVGVISTGLFLSLPALALLQPKTTSQPLASEGEQLLSQSENGDSGDDSGDNSGDNSGDDSGDSSGDNDNGNSDSSDNGDDSSDSADSDTDDGDDSGDNAGNPGGGNGDSGEVFRTRGESSEGGAPYVGVGEPGSDENSTSQ